MATIGQRSGRSVTNRLVTVQVMPNGINHTSFVLTETGGSRSSNSYEVSEVRMMWIVTGLLSLFI